MTSVSRLRSTTLQTQPLLRKTSAAAIGSTPSSTISQALAKAISEVRNFASSPAGLEKLSLALSAKGLSSSDRTKFMSLLNSLGTGQFNLVSVNPGDRKNDLGNNVAVFLPAGQNGVSRPTIMVSTLVAAGDLLKTLVHEVGEAIGSLATAKGLTVSGGEVGDRFVNQVLGRAAAQHQMAQDFETNGGDKRDRSDLVTVLFAGRKVYGNAIAGGPAYNPKYIKAFAGDKMNVEIAHAMLWLGKKTKVFSEAIASGLMTVVQSIFKAQHDGPTNLDWAGFTPQQGVKLSDQESADFFVNFLTLATLAVPGLGEEATAAGAVFTPAKWEGDEALLATESGITTETLDAEIHAAVNGDLVAQMQLQKDVETAIQTKLETDVKSVVHLVQTGKNATNEDATIVTEVTTEIHKLEVMEDGADASTPFGSLMREDMDATILNLRNIEGQAYAEILAEELKTPLQPEWRPYTDPLQQIASKFENDFKIKIPQLQITTNNIIESKSPSLIASRIETLQSEKTLQLHFKTNTDTFYKKIRKALDFAAPPSDTPDSVQWMMTIGRVNLSKAAIEDSNSAVVADLDRMIAELSSALPNATRSLTNAKSAAAVIAKEASQTIASARSEIAPLVQTPTAGNIAKAEKILQQSKADEISANNKIEAMESKLSPAEQQQFEALKNEVKNAGREALSFTLGCATKAMQGPVNGALPQAKEIFSAVTAEIPALKRTSITAADAKTAALKGSPLRQITDNPLFANQIRTLGSTLASNSIFSLIGFVLGEISGSKTPLLPSAVELHLVAKNAPATVAVVGGYELPGMKTSRDSIDIGIRGPVIGKVGGVDWAYNLYVSYAMPTTGIEKTGNGTIYAGVSALARVVAPGWGQALLGPVKNDYTMFAGGLLGLFAARNLTTNTTSGHIITSAYVDVNPKPSWIAGAPYHFPGFSLKFIDNSTLSQVR